MPKLVLIAKGKARTIEMGQELTIGRGYSNLLRLEGEEISRVHAIIYKRNQDYIVRDLDSKNGIYVNGNKTAFAELGPGDKLQVGKYRMIFDPPSGFQVEDLENSGMSRTASGSGPEALHVNESDFSRSQRFSVTPHATGAVVATETPEPELCREEVLIYSRAELNDRLLNTRDTAVQKCADYQDEFFNQLLEKARFSSNSAFSELVLQSLVLATGAHRGVVILRTPASSQLSPAAVYPVNEDVAVNSVVLRSGFSEGKAMLCPSARDCGLFRDSATVTRDRIATLASVPLGADDTIGLLYIDRQGEDADPFNISHFLLAGRIARLLECHLADVANARRTTS